MAVPVLQVIEGDLPEYPISRDVRLDGHSFVKWHHHRWLQSRMCLRGDFECKGMARDLFDVAQTQSPVGTLPADTDDCALLIRADRARFADLCRREFGPLHGWVRCVSGGELRLMHPVVLEQVQDALDRREVSNLSREEKAVYQRQKRLRAAWAGLGVGKDALADDVLIARVDGWMAETVRGNRKQVHYESALVHAAKVGWMAELAGPRGR